MGSWPSSTTESKTVGAFGIGAVLVLIVLAFTFRRVIA